MEHSEKGSGESRHLKIARTSIILLASIASIFQALAQTNGIPKELLDASTAWGAESNGVRAGLAWSFEKDTVLISVLLLATDPAKTGRLYVAPPGRKFAGIELRDTNTVLVKPLSKAKGMTANMPQHLAVSELPRTPRSGFFRGHGPMIRDRLMFSTSGPAPLAQLALSDLYRVKSEGDYTLMIWPVIYQAGTNSDYVDRLDLPAVRAKFHLAPPN